MPALPWKRFGELEPDHEYVVLASTLPLKRLATTPKMMRLTSAVRKQLAATPGVLGYTLNAKPLAKRYYTLSIWRDADALGAFVEHVPHLDVMATMAPEMSQTKFVRWTMRGSDPLPTWRDALQRVS